jgi:hypothetical protein
MVDVLRVFVGAAKIGNSITCGDSQELEQMGREKLAEGWEVGQNLSETKKIIRERKAQKVFISGGLAGVCAAESGITAIEAGAKEVRYNLHELRYSSTDDSSNFQGEDTLQIRRSYLKAGLKNYANDKRIVIEK